MLRFLFGGRTRDVNALYEGHYIDAKAFYTIRFNRVPCIGFIGELDTGNAMGWIRERYRVSVRDVFQHAYYEHADGRMYFNNTLFVLRENRMIELGPNYAMVLFTPRQYAWGNGLVAELAQFRMAPPPETAPVTRVIGFARNADRN